MEYLYNSRFAPSQFIQDKILKNGKICATDETPDQMINRVIGAIYNADRQFTSNQTGLSKAAFSLYSSSR